MLFRSENRLQNVVALLLIMAGAAFRVLPHPDNFAPVAAIALFSGVVLSPGLALTIPLLIMMASDLLLGLHSLFLWAWSSFFLVSLLGVGIRKNPRLGLIFAGSLAGSLIYFVVTNLGVFFVDNLYPKTWAGLYECFVMALPFFRNSILSDLFFTSCLFGIFAIVKNYSLKAAPQR